MPPLPVTPSNVLRCHLKFTVDADTDVLPRFYLAYSGPAPTPTQLNAVCATIGGAWTGAFQQWQYTGVSLTEVTAEDVGPAGAASGFSSVTGPGTRTGNANTAATCVVVNFSIARRYRGGKPKAFLPLGVNADLNSAGQWVPGLITGVDAAWPNFINGCKGASWPSGSITGQVNVSYYSGFTSVQNPITKRYRNVPTLRATPLVDPISAANASPIVGSQRRRNRGGG